MTAPDTFRAIWPIVDESVSYAALCKEATAELPAVIARAHAQLLSPGRFSIAPSVDVPGSGRVTESVLIYEAPATAVPRRSYWRAAS